MKITIERKRVCGWAIEGTLTIDGKRICDTAECKDGAVPEGEYTVRLQYMRPYQKRMMVLWPKRPDGIYPNDGRLPIYDLKSGRWQCRLPDWQLPREYEAGINTLMPFCVPMLKPGNGVNGRTDGSIIVGRAIGIGGMLHPVGTYQRLYDRIRQAIHRRKEVIVEIK